MEDIYRAPPAHVPADLTIPAEAYKRRAWLAMLALVLFVSLYFALATWLGWTAYRLYSNLWGGGVQDPLGAFFVASSAAFLSLFMFKAVFFIRRGSQLDDFEVTAADQPRLFEFLNRLADDARAPRPHRVFLSGRVNAAVFYDLSLANLLLPSRKNLEIGLALANAVNLGELKAVLAHEFGHFAQRSMAVGRWVYVAQQIASHLVERRDAFDRFLLGLSRADLRVAWIGWVLRLVIWSIRSLVELLFRGVVVAQHALSREMEYQADLVAVSLTGSDALINALHRLGAADDCWSRTLHFAASERQSGRSVSDLFAVQTRMIELMRGVLADPGYGTSPALPKTDPQSFRVFKDDLAQPPQMWSTHPENSDRERNAKRRYVALDADERSAWVLFTEPEAIRAQVSARVMPAPDGAAVTPVQNSLRMLDDSFSHIEFSRRYRGAYLGRSAVRQEREAAALFAGVDAGTDLRSAIADLYGDGLDATLDQLRELESEHQTLIALQKGHLDAPGGVVRWRGDEVPRRNLPTVIAHVSAEMERARAAVHQHHRDCRGLHLAAASSMGRGWDKYLAALTRLLHYAEHTRADLLDASALMHNTLAVVTADGNVSNSELSRLLKDANVLQSTLRKIHEDGPQVLPGAHILASLQLESWPQALGEFKLPPATRENIQDWMGVVDGWVHSAADAFGRLERESLRTLLATEDRLAAALAGDVILDAALEPALVPARYATLPLGAERKRQERLGWWDRFQTADGWPAATARFAAATCVLGSVLVFAGATGQSTVEIFNGLSVPVVVRIDGAEQVVAPYAHLQQTVDRLPLHQVVAATVDGRLIERFEQKIDPGKTHFVYNIGGAAAMTRWYASYGTTREQAPEDLGSRRWFDTWEDYVFEEPPESVQTKTGGALKSVLTAVADAPPGLILAHIKDKTQAAATVATHARFDAADSRHAVQWLAAANLHADIQGILQERLSRTPDEVVSLRAEQDAASKEQRNAVCRRHSALAEASPNSPEFVYLALRCQEDSPRRNAAFLEAQQRLGGAWLDYSAGLVLSERGKWSDAATLLQSIPPRLPAMADRAVLVALRALRASDPVDQDKIDELRRANPHLESHLELELPSDSTVLRPEHAFMLLQAGDTAAAVKLSRQDEDLFHRITRLVALSTGATTDEATAALALPESQSMEPLLAWPLWALALRESAESTETYKTASASTSDAETRKLTNFILALRNGEGSEKAHTAIEEISIESRAAAYIAATVLLGKDCPREWRELARRLTFVHERPNLET